MKRELSPKERLIFALDLDSFDSAKKYVAMLKDDIGMFKVGNQLFTNSGADILKLLRSYNLKVFLDLKYHDIPNTVASAAIEATRLGVAMFNMHALGGYEMMSKAAEASKDTALKEHIKDRPIILAVTLLTSVSEALLQEIGIDAGMKDEIIRLARLAKKAGVDGVVASPEDAKFIREECGDDFFIVTPGIRPSSSAKDDHHRLSLPSAAIENGADYIVVGRPVKDAKDPVLAARMICSELDTKDYLKPLS